MAVRTRDGTVRSLSGLRSEEGKTLTDTPIYDQITREFQAGIALADPPAPPRAVAATTQHAATRSNGDDRRPVSVWTLVDQYRAHQR